MSDKQDALTALFPATLRKKLLTLIFLRPDEEFHAGELARLLDVSRGALARELIDMTAAGVLARARRGNQVLYRANHDAHFFPELRRLIQQLAGAVPALKQAVEAYADDIDIACVFGSMARGDAGPDSDIDLLLVGDRITGRIKAELRVAMTDAGRALDILDLTRAQYAELLDQDSPFIREVLDGPLIMLIGKKELLHPPHPGRLTARARHPATRSRILSNAR
ncbi:hypothetical protein DDE05_05990 [Streptomyces cavourensis]|nr:hypothetical protein DDE05_05990 [Streptomyces cavourensis]